MTLFCRERKRDWQWEMEAILYAVLTPYKLRPAKGKPRTWLSMSSFLSRHFFCLRREKQNEWLEIHSLAWGASCNWNRREGEKNEVVCGFRSFLSCCSLWILASASLYSSLLSIHFNTKTILLSWTLYSASLSYLLSHHYYPLERKAILKRLSSVSLPLPQSLQKRNLSLPLKLLLNRICKKWNVSWNFIASYFFASPAFYLFSVTFERNNKTSGINKILARLHRIRRW